MSTSSLTLSNDPHSFYDDQQFFTRMSAFVALFVAFGFIQFAARGMVNLAAVPWWVHVHAAAMISWLALFVTQNVLAERGKLQVHRRLGWIGLALAIVTAPLGVYSGRMAITQGAALALKSD